MGNVDLDLDVTVGQHHPPAAHRREPVTAGGLVVRATWSLPHDQPSVDGPGAHTHPRPGRLNHRRADDLGTRVVNSSWARDERPRCRGPHPTNDSQLADVSRHLGQAIRSAASRSVSRRRANR